MKKLHGLICSMAISLTATTCFADVPINTCTQYLSASDNAFYSLIASNNAAAASAAQTLDACQSANACTDINGIDNCGATLANRFFMSEYYTILSGNGASSSYGSAAPQNGSIQTNNRESAVSIGATKNNTPHKNDSSIHWF